MEEEINHEMETTVMNEIETTVVTRISGLAAEQWGFEFEIENEVETIGFGL